MTSEPIAPQVGFISAPAQNLGKLMFQAGAVRLFDTDSSHDAENPVAPGRVVIEPFTGSGFAGDQKNGIYVEQSETWAQVFAYVVCISPAAQAAEPALAIGQQIVFERYANNDRVRIDTPLGTALFSVIHVEDVYAIVK